MRRASSGASLDQLGVAEFATAALPHQGSDVTIPNDDRDQFAARHVGAESPISDHLVETIVELCLGLARDGPFSDSSNVRMISNMFFRSVTSSCAW